MIPYTPPAYKLDAFNCPYCQAFADQKWYQGWAQSDIKHTSLQGIEINICERCKNFSIWLNSKMIFPDNPGIPSVNQDLEQAIKDDFEEAKNIVNKSPRGAAALLRLAIQKLCIQLGENGKDINSDIASLVKKGLNPLIQKSLDIVRVIGNNAVHPGELDLKDDSENAIKLFDLVNLIAETMITKPKEIEKMYESLPESKRIAIDDRDKKSD